MNSKIIIGTWPLSGDYGKIEFEKIKNVLEYCYQNGIREFDTAPNYGNGSIERNLGQIFGDKDEVLINTNPSFIYIFLINFHIREKILSFLLQSLI